MPQPIVNILPRLTEWRFSRILQSIATLPHRAFRAYCQNRLVHILLKGDHRQLESMAVAAALHGRRGVPGLLSSPLPARLLDRLDCPHGLLPAEAALFHALRLGSTEMLQPLARAGSPIRIDDERVREAVLRLLASCPPADKHRLYVDIRRMAAGCSVGSSLALPGLG